MKIFILFLVVSYSQAIDFDCLKGPSFWCASEENAIKCNRITECTIANMNGEVRKMSRMEIPVVCDLCKKIITQLEKDFIPQVNEVQFINYVAINVCPKLGSELRDVCVTLIRQYGHEVYTEILAILDPNYICSYTELCGINVTRIKSAETCKICKELFTFLESVWANLTPAELKTLLKLVLCKNLPSSTQSMCDTLVDGYTDQLYELLKSLLDGDRICPVLHLCPTSLNSEVSDWSQQTCIDVVTILKKDLVNVPNDQVINLVDAKACSQVPSMFKGICSNLVNENVVKFLNKLHSAETPTQICAEQLGKFLGQSLMKETLRKPMGNVLECDACEVVVKEVKKLLLSKEGELKIKNFIKNEVCIFFGNQRQKCMDFVDKYADILINFINNQLTDRQICILLGACSETESLLLKPPTSRIGTIKCETCELILTEVKKFIANPDNQARMKNFLKSSVCPLFQQESTQCQQVIDEYFNLIINAIISQFDVDMICKAGGFCPQVSVVSSKITIYEAVECEVCEVVIRDLIQLATENATEQRVETFMTSVVCPKLRMLKDECDSLMKTYLPYIFSAARNSLNSKILCSRLKLCSVVTRQKMDSLMRSLKVKSFQCDMCQFVVNETINLLSDSAIQTTLENFIKKEICPYFGKRSQECENDITEYYSFVINLVLEFLTPNVCNDIKLCSSTSEKLWKDLIISHNNMECYTCQRFYKYLKSVTYTTMRNDISINLKGLCSSYHHQDKEKCLALIKIEKLIGTSIMAKNMGEFCRMNGLCVAKVDGCIWGPSFWCISEKHAQLCGNSAVKHCQLKVWKKSH